MLTLLIIVSLLISTPAAAIMYCHKTFCPPPMEETKDTLEKKSKKEKSKKIK